MTHYETLGLTSSATLDEIKAAGRSLSQRWHPDKEDGDEDRFKSIMKAYEVLRSPEKRARYDAGKDPDGEGDAQRQAALSALFMQMVDKLGESSDLIEEMRAHFRKQKQAINVDIQGFQQAIRRREKMMKKVIRKTGENFIAAAMRQDIEQKRGLIENCQRMLAQCDELLDDLKDFVFEAEPRPYYSDTLLRYLDTPFANSPV